MEDVEEAQDEELAEWAPTDTIAVNGEERSVVYLDLLLLLDCSHVHSGVHRQSFEVAASSGLALPISCT